MYDKTQTEVNTKIFKDLQHTNKGDQLKRSANLKK